MAVTRDRAWDGLWQKVDALRGALTRNRAVNVNSQPLREQAREAVQQYFREVRPDLGALQVGDQSIESVDRSFQELLRLAQGSNAKRSYLKVLKELSKELSRSLLNLAERDGTASYPQFTAMQGIPT
jgi:hypothetical protein